MAATAYGYSASQFKARPDFSARRDGKGGWTGSNSFSMLRETWENYGRGAFVKGTPITDLYTELNDYWAFLILDEVEVSNEPGGVTIVRCDWVGFLEADYDEAEEAVFTLSGTRVERSILFHPMFQKEVIDNVAVDAVDKPLVAAVHAGTFVADPAKQNTFNDYHLRGTVDAAIGKNTTQPEVIKWIRCILEQGIKTFKAPTVQWTVETTSLTGWKDEDLDHLGLVQYDRDNRPPGNPPMPRFGKWEWMKISMNQTTTDGKTRQSQTWELVPPGGGHRFLPPDEADGLYNYQPSDLGPPS